LAQALPRDGDDVGVVMGQETGSSSAYPLLDEGFPGVPAVDPVPAAGQATPYPRLDEGFPGVPPPDDLGAVPPTGSSASSTFGPSGINRIDALRYGVKWGSGGAGTPASLDHSFPGYSAPWEMYYGYGEPDNGFRPLSAQQQSAANKALQLWSDVANISFHQITESASNVGDIRFGNTLVNSDRYAAFAYYPNPIAEAGDVWFNATYDYNTDIDGTYPMFVNIHELGHAIGLKHPFEGYVVLPPEQDWVGNTVMSYNGRTGFLPSTPMLYDIAAAQYIYGANTATRSGDTVYKWATGEQIFETIWDGGGKDTIDWSNQSSAAEINLNAGTWSELGPANFFGVDTLAIAFNVTIENARGGTANDELFGNAVANSLYGNSGNDLIYASGGADILYGDLGNDTIYGQDGDDTVYGGRSLDDPTDGADRIYGDAGNDQVWAGGGDDIVYGGAGNEIHLSGQSGNDTLYGDAGTDYVAGGSGNDTLYGGTENDRLSGTDGLDRLFGQGGTDTFDYDAVSHSGLGSSLRDVVGDFTGVGGTTRTEVIDLSTIDANTSASGNQAFTFRGTSAFSAPGQIRVQASGTSDTLIQANVTGTSGAEMEIVVTDGSVLPTAWNALDFLL
jgi:serralysin